MNRFALALLAFGFATAANAQTPNPRATITTNQGVIVVELDAVKAPKSTDNFVQYVKAGQYDGTIFHRVIDNFMIQGGGYTTELVPKGGERAPIQNEAANGLSNLRGTLAMARANEPNSATSQFYINVVDNPGLDYRSEEQPGFAVFGRVIAGLELVDAISVVPTRSVPSLGLTHLPVTDVVVLGARQVR